jgi:hypothetical protein
MKQYIQEELIKISQSLFQLLFLANKLLRTKC